MRNVNKNYTLTLHRACRTRSAGLAATSPLRRGNVDPGQGDASPVRRDGLASSHWRSGPDTTIPSSPSRLRPRLCRSTPRTISATRSVRTLWLTQRCFLQSNRIVAKFCAAAPSPAQKISPGLTPSSLVPCPAMPNRALPYHALPWALPSLATCPAMPNRVLPCLASSRARSSCAPPNLAPQGIQLSSRISPPCRSVRCSPLGRGLWTQTLSAVSDPGFEAPKQPAALRAIVAEPDPGSGYLCPQANIEQIGHVRIVLGGDLQ